MAWLNTSPAKSKAPRSETVDIELPDLGGADYIISLAYEFGFKTEWAELAAWQELTSRKLSRFEVKAIYAASVAYRNGIDTFSGVDTPRPYYKKGVKRDSQSIRNAIRNR